MGSAGGSSAPDAARRSLLLPSSCSSPCLSRGEDPGSVRLLLDGDHAPDVLIEEQRRSPSLPRSAGTASSPAGGPAKKGSWCCSRPRSPTPGCRSSIWRDRAPDALLDLLEPPARPGKVRVRAAGRDLGAFPADRSGRDPTARRPAPRPGDVDLAFELGVARRAGRGGPAVPARRQGGAPRRRPRPVRGLARPTSCAGLRRRDVGGDVRPAGRPRPRPALRADRRDGSTAARSAASPGRPASGTGSTGTRRSRLPLGDAPGFVRVRLLARGAGPAARWEELGLRRERNGRAGKAVAKAEPPSQNLRGWSSSTSWTRCGRTVGHLGGPAGVSPTFDRLAREG